MHGFYVYEHVRKDTGHPFYVGKGSGARMKVTQHRNIYWRRVAEKAGYEASIVASSLDEELAFLVEMELISKYRALGVRLTNMSDGGEGPSGYKPSQETIKKRVEKQRGQSRPSVSIALKGRAKSLEHRANLSASRKGYVTPDAVREKQSMARRGKPGFMLGKRHTEEVKKKISQSLIGEKNHFFGKTHSPETLLKLSLSHQGVKASDETRKKMSESRLGEKNPRYGVTIPENQKLRQIAKLKARPRVVCPHCEKSLDEANAKRWHFDNCNKVTK